MSYLAKGNYSGGNFHPPAQIRKKERELTSVEVEAIEMSKMSLYNMLYMSLDVEVKPYKDPPSKTMRNYRITRVVSPFLFNTEFDLPRPLGNFDDWYLAMQDFYNNPEVSNFYKLKTPKLQKFRCYVHLDPETEKWERVRAMTEGIHESVDVFLCDFNEMRTVPLKSLKELNPDFATWSSQGFVTHLANIRPSNGSNFWPKDAVEYFKKLVQGKTFRSLIVSRSESPYPSSFPETILHIGVVMIQNNPLGQRTLQAEMIKAGFAIACGVFGGYSDMLGSQPGFNVEGFEKAPEHEFKNEYVDLPIHARPSAADIKKMVSDADIRMEILKSNALEKEKEEDFENAAANSQESSIYCRKKTVPPTVHIPELFFKRMCRVKFTTVVSPGIFYVQMEKNIRQLQELEASLSAIVQRQPQIPLTEAREGIAIACLLQEDRNREPCWVRGIVKACLPQVKLIKVVLVDYGTEISVKYPFTRYLPTFFCKIPGFAYRVYLNSEIMSPVGGRWTSDSADTFRRYVSSWENDQPLYFAWIPHNAKVLDLENYSQDVQWDPNTHLWSLAPVKKNPNVKSQCQLKACPLLKNIFTAFGIDIQYELINQNSNYYQFAPVGEMLLDCGYAARIQPNRRFDDEHRSVLEFNTNLREVRRQLAINTGQLALGNQQRNMAQDLARERIVRELLSKD